MLEYHLILLDLPHHLQLTHLDLSFRKEKVQFHYLLLHLVINLSHKRLLLLQLLPPLLRFPIILPILGITVSIILTPNHNMIHCLLIQV